MGEPRRHASYHRQRWNPTRIQIGAARFRGALFTDVREARHVQVFLFDPSAYDRHDRCEIKGLLLQAQPIPRDLPVRFTGAHDHAARVCHVDLIRERAGLEAQAGVLAVTLSMPSHDAIEMIAGIELNAGRVGPHRQLAATAGVVEPYDGFERFAAFTHDITMIEAACTRELIMRPVESGAERS